MGDCTGEAKFDMNTGVCANLTRTEQHVYDELRDEWSATMATAYSAFAGKMIERLYEIAAEGRGEA